MNICCEQNGNVSGLSPAYRTLGTRCAGETLTGSGASCLLRRRKRSRSTTARVSSWSTLHWVARDLGSHSYLTFPPTESMFKWSPSISSGDSPTSSVRFVPVVRHQGEGRSKPTSPLLPSLRRFPLFICSSCIRETLDAALAEYNAANAVMDLVLFDEVRCVRSVGTLEAQRQSALARFHVMALTKPKYEAYCLVGSSDPRIVPN